MIDDAFNSNPVGAKNAVEILGAFRSSQRFIITPGIVELGNLEAEENYKFGTHIAKAKLDYAFIVGLDRGKVIEQGYLEAGETLNGWSEYSLFLKLMINSSNVLNLEI